MNGRSIGLLVTLLLVAEEKRKKNKTKPLRPCLAKHSRTNPEQIDI